MRSGDLSSALTDLLGRLGIDAPELTAVASIDDCLAELAKHGLIARSVEIQGRDGKFLIRPAIIGSEGTGWSVIGDEHPHVQAGLVAIEVVGRRLDGGLGVAGRVRAILKDRPHLISSAASAAMVLVLTTALGPYIAGLVMSRAVPDGARFWLQFAALGTMAVGLVAAIGTYFKARVSLALEPVAAGMLQRGILDHLLRMPYLAVTKHSTSDLMLVTRAQESGVRLIQIVSDLAANLVAFLLNILVLLYTQTNVAGSIVGIAVLAGSVTVVLGRYQARANRGMMEAKARQQAYAGEMIRGISTLKACASEERSLKAWHRLLAEELDRTVAANAVTNLARLVMELLQRVVPWVAMVWGGSIVLEGKAEAASLMAFLLTAAIVSGAVASIAAGGIDLIAEIAVVNRIDEVIKGEQKPSDHRGPTRGPVVLRDVWFRYTSADPWVLKGFSMAVDPGEVLWLRSPSGTGKTTILRIISGLVRPEKGLALVGGEPSYMADRPICYMPQSVHLFDDSIMGNLKIFSGHASHEAIMDASIRTGLNDLVSTLPMGYLSRATANSFSGGQRQLMLMTAAVAMDAGILLLDEPMSAMDWVMRRQVAKVLRDSGKTIIYVSHDVPIGGHDKVVDMGAQAPRRRATDLEFA